MKKIYFTPLIISIFLITIMPFSAVQAEVRQSETDVYVSESEVVDDNLIVVTDFANIGGRIEGDLIVVAKTANIKGEINGDVLIAGGNIVIDGTVNGDIRAAGGSIIINGPVEGNITVAGGDITIGEKATIGHSIMSAGGKIDILGSIQRNITVFAGRIFMNGSAGENVFMNVDRKGTVTLGGDTRIGGSVHYTAGKDIERRPGAEVAGSIVKTDIPFTKDAKHTKNNFYAFYALLMLARFIGMAVVGLVFVHVWKKFTEKTIENLIHSPGKILFYGFAAFFLVPILIFLLTITLIGIPLALMVFAAYLVSLYLAKIIFAIALGTMVLKKASKNIHDNMMVVVLVGVFLFVLITSIPLLGGVAGILGVWWGLGMLVYSLKGVLK